MKYSPQILMATLRMEIGPAGLFILALGLIAIGVFLILTPPEHLLKSDRKTAYWLYRQELKASGDEKRAIAAGGVFYKVLGGCMVAFGTFIFLLGLISLFSRDAP